MQQVVASVSAWPRRVRARSIREQEAHIEAAVDVMARIDVQRQIFAYVAVSDLVRVSGVSSKLGVLVRASTCWKGRRISLVNAPEGLHNIPDVYVRLFSEVVMWPGNLEASWWRGRGDTVRPPAVPRRAAAAFASFAARLSVMTSEEAVACAAALCEAGDYRFGRVEDIDKDSPDLRNDLRSYEIERLRRAAYNEDVIRLAAVGCSARGGQLEVLDLQGGDDLDTPGLDALAMTLAPQLRSLNLDIQSVFSPLVHPARGSPPYSAGPALIVLLSRCTRLAVLKLPCLSGAGPEESLGERVMRTVAVSCGPSLQEIDCSWNNFDANLISDFVQASPQLRKFTYVTHIPGRGGPGGSRLTPAMAAALRHGILAGVPHVDIRV